MTPKLTVSDNIVNTQQKQLVALIKFALYNPGWTSSLIENTLVSARRDAALNGEATPEFISAFTTNLDEAVKRRYPELSAVCDTAISDDGTTTTMTINIVDGVGATVLDASAVINDGTITIKDTGPDE